MVFIQNGRRAPPWICWTRIGTTHDEYLVVSIVVLNLVGIDACSSFDNMKLSIFCPFNLKTFAIACFRPTAEATFRSC